VIFVRFLLLKSPVAVFGGVAIVLGVFLLILAAALVFFIPGPAAAVAFGNAVIWLGMGIVFTVVSRIGSCKLERLRHSGMEYNAKIIRLMPNFAIKINNIPNVRAECIYVNELGRRCKVISRMFLWESFNVTGLDAKVFADRDNPGKYAVEITRAASQDVPVDIDYTK
jgi:hypothetical protein